LPAFYTGDYSRSEDRHLTPAELPDMKPDILITEATYGVQTLQPVSHARSYSLILYIKYSAWWKSSDSCVCFGKSARVVADSG